ncbi:MAG: family 43 glycosylhydrolase [Bacteroidales bacterium]|nr:family 43 glycosylhydrolase [Bacteroidales bacterium]
MKNAILSVSFLFIMTAMAAQNPIVQPGVYLADPSAHQWKDGKMYVYGSRDESPVYYCSWSHDILSSSDLNIWTIYKNRFSSKGPGDEVRYSDDNLYAPDCQYANGSYYMYYCLANNSATEGVAVSKEPTGPFINGKNIRLSGYNEIDPCVFIDDDGQAYYIWGQFSAKMAKLKSDMTEIDSSTIKTNIVTEKEHFFHEGGYMVKRNGIYYFIYAHMGRAGRPTCIGYATSMKPMGPFRYGGVIIDNDHCDPGCWNNHGSIAQFNGNWYVFYHRSTHGSNTMRKACIEPIFFNGDGSINEVEMTSQGAALPLKSDIEIDAARACLLYGNVRIARISDNNEALTDIRNGDVAAYKYLDFKSESGTLHVNAIPGKKEVIIDIALDNSWSPSIGSLIIPADGEAKSARSYSCVIKKVSGIHSLWFRFKGDTEDSFCLDSFIFN